VLRHVAHRRPHLHISTPSNRKEKIAVTSSTSSELAD
jgi:hypothetical protein